MSTELGVRHGAEFRRCLLECDVGGLIALQKHVDGNELSPYDATISLHMARVEVSNFPRKVRDYSVAWLKERGYIKKDGRWQRSDALELRVFGEAVGISSSTIGGHKYKLHHDIEYAMSDTIMNAYAKGIMEAPMHVELLDKTRTRIRFKHRV